MIKVTIGVPVYNSERFIKQALESFSKQTMKKDEFEVLFVDDCSTDNSVEVINSYKDKMNLTVIKMKQNSGGPGAPRNKVIEKAEGEYIFFVDSDDYIHEESLHNMYTFAKENNSDVLLAKMKGINGRGVPQSMFKTTESNVDLYDSRIVYTLGPTKLFKTSLLRENKIYFPEALKSAEDQIFTMKSYLKASVISVLSNKDYYYATLHDGDHMNSAYVYPNDFFSIMSNIVDEIFATNEDIKRKNWLASTFLNRHFHFSRTANFSIKNKSQEDKEEWMRALNKFLKNHVPESVDILTAEDVRPRVALARNSDLENYNLFEKALQTNDIKYVIESGQIYAKFDFLKEYPNVNNLNFTILNKMVHKLTNIKMDNKKITLTCFVKHTKLSDQHNQSQQIKAVLVHRGNKEEKYISPIVSQPKSQIYTFEIPYEALISSKEDLGIWDLFIESTVESYVLRGRIGNKRNKYQYRDETSFIGDNHLFNYRVTPYFTKPYDNFSIYTKKLTELEREVTINYDKKAKYLTIEYPDMHLILPENSVINFWVKSQKYTVMPEHVLWEKADTRIVLTSFIISNNRKLRSLNFNSAQLNGLSMKLS